MKRLSESDLKKLRLLSIINENETAYIVDDLVIAEVVTTGEKRKIDVPATVSLSESKKSLLKG
jgi:hypothetical protein